MLFIGGEGRSGSTLLDMILGQLPSVISCGEIRHIWDEALEQNPLCSCGAPFGLCSVWRRVGEVAFGGWDAPAVAEFVRLQRRLDRTKYIPAILLSRQLGWPSRWIRAYTDGLSRLYRGIQEVSGASVIVDSSKFPSAALLLALCGTIDLRVVHLVRDSRGVAYSWSKSVVKPDTSRPMPTYHPVAIGARWVYLNLAFSVLRAVGVPVMLLKYEEFVCSPQGTLQAVLEHLDEAHLARHLPEVFSGDRVALVKQPHIVAGNYNKMDRDIVFREDDEWRERMSWKDRLGVALVTWPLLWKYGYLRS